MADNIIETRQLVKTFGKVTALDHVDMTVARGEIYGLVGDNGAGKSTLFKILTGQSFPTAGEIRLFDAHLPWDLRRQRGRTGVIVERPAVYPQLSVETNLEYIRIQKGVPGKGAVKAVLKTVDLYHSRKKRGRELSMGMLQRLGLAIALIGEPEVLILDEPINGLDPTGVVEMRALLATLNRDKNITILLSSHILPVMQQLATVYGFMSGGRMLEQITAKELEERCDNYIDLMVPDKERYAALLEKNLGHTNYKVLPDGTIRISQPQREAAEYSRLASNNGIAVSKLERRKMVLEDYYFHLKNGGRPPC